MSLFDHWLTLVTAPLFLWSWMGLAVATAVVLTRLSAPYGRHARGGWGPSFPASWSWMTMEAVSLVGFGLCFALSAQRDAVSWVWLGLYALHYGYRSFVYPFLGSQKGAPVPVSVSGLAVVFNVFNGTILGAALFGGAPVGWPPTGWTAVGVALFAAGFAVHVHADGVLRNLRKVHGPGYHVPKGGLYRWVSCPNYLGEIMEWVGFAIMMNHLAGWTFAVWTAANLLPRAVAHHRWYRKRFEDYPSDRKAIVPGLI